MSNVPLDIQQIINDLRQRDMQVTGPTPKNEELVYRITNTV